MDMNKMRRGENLPLVFLWLYAWREMKAAI
jgi:hypothetical protein